MFFDLCGINKLNKSERIKLLCDVRPLETRKPYKLDENGKKIWHPDWDRNVDDEVNAAFIQEVAGLVWGNEEVS
jgi:hypothetical protein